MARPTFLSHFASRHVAFSVIAGACVTLAGCGQKNPLTAPVKGKVALNGQPLKSGNVITLPSNGRGAHGAITSDGSFELGTFTKDDGAIIDTHKVAVVALVDGVRTEPEGGAKLLVPERYANPQSSGLTIEVKAGEVNELTLDLTSP
jgi:predicted small lipoprotein YifL